MLDYDYTKSKAAEAKECLKDLIKTMVARPMHQKYSPKDIHAMILALRKGMSTS